MNFVGKVITHKEYKEYQELKEQQELKKYQELKKKFDNS